MWSISTLILARNMVDHITWSRTNIMFSVSYLQVYIHISKDNQKKNEKQGRGKSNVFRFFTSD